MIILAIIVACLQFALAFQAMRNLRLFPKLQQSDDVGVKHMISVCLPMRNEEVNVARLLDSILLERSVILEIIILDDESIDSTPSIIHLYLQKYPEFITLIHGKPKPDDWRGKVWAMSQVANDAEGEYLLFMDSDVYLKRGAISSIIQQSHNTNADYFSIFPRQITTPSTDLLVNHIFSTLLHLLPMQLVGDKKYPSAVAGCGQVQLFRKDTLSKIGGYEAIKDSLHDGLHTARRMKQAGYSVAFAYGSDLVSCKMYNSFSEAWSGFIRNSFQATGSVIALFFTSLTLLSAFVIGPLVSMRCFLSSLIVLCSTFVLYANYFRIIRTYHLAGSFLFRLPFSIILSTILQWVSFFKNALGLRSSWKGRKA